MSRAESVALLEQLGLVLSPDEIETLHERIEGWPAALYLAGLSRRRAPRASFVVSGFSGYDQFVSDYFRDEFLAEASPARLRFLMRSSSSRT